MCAGRFLQRDGKVLIPSSQSLASTLLSVLEDPQAFAGAEAAADSTISEVEDGTYKNWLEREVPIASIAWADGSTFSNSYCILADMLLNTNILNSRMRNYSNFRFDAIKVRVVINATPFRSGILMGSWTPLNVNKNMTRTYGTSTLGECPYFSGGVSEVEQGTTVPGCSQADFCYVMARSQRTPVFANVCDSQGFEYTIPWRHYRDSLVIDTAWPTSGTANFANQFYNFGYFTLESLGIPLKAGNATTTPVTVLIYARFVNPRVWGPTFASQSGVFADPAVLHAGPARPLHDAHEATPPVHVDPQKDERTNTMKPSEIASAVADAAGALSSVPVVGFWATATSIVARGASALLGLFGWSNPPIISGRQGMQLYSNVHSNNPCISRQDDVIALDPRNEVTVDPRLTGGPGEDELIISKWCARPVVLDTIKFNVADTPGQLLLSIPVSPNHCYQTYVNNTATGSIPCVRSTMPPYTYAAQAFDFWRGRFHMRLTPVISSFHKGSIKIWWDPIGYGISNQIGLQKTMIHEINAGPIDFTVDFAAAVGFLSVDPSPITNATSASVAATNYWGNRAAATPVISDNLTRYFNGVVNVQVLNRLQGETDIYFVLQTWFEDMMFAVPRSDVEQTKGTISQCAVTNFVTQAGVEASGKSRKLGLLYTGESVKSIRTLFDRSSIWRILYNNVSTGAGPQTLSYDFPRFPLCKNALVKDLNSTTKYFQDDTYGVFSTQGSLATNWCNTTVIGYFTRCFVGHRGSIVWRAQPFDQMNGDVGAIYNLSRSNARTATTVFGKSSYQAVSINNGMSFYLQRLFGSGTAGVVNCTSIDRICGGVFPSYFKYRMMGGDSNHYMDAAVVSGNEWDTNMFNYDKIKFTSVGATGYPRLTTLCCAAGADFSPLEFLSCPDVYVANVTPPANT